MAISFVNLPKSLLKGKKNSVKLWLRNTAQIHKHQIEQLTFNFCSDSELLKINREFLKHTSYTDIITFDYSKHKKISGEIYISIDRVFENATQFSVEKEMELLRVMVHGALHLCGFKDKSAKNKVEMRRKEEQALKNFIKKTRKK